MWASPRVCKHCVKPTLQNCCLLVKSYFAFSGPAVFFFEVFVNNTRVAVVMHEFKLPVLCMTWKSFLTGTILCSSWSHCCSRKKHHLGIWCICSLWEPNWYAQEGHSYYLTTKNIWTSISFCLCNLGTPCEIHHLLQQETRGLKCGILQVIGNSKFILCNTLDYNLNCPYLWLLSFTFPGCF